MLSILNTILFPLIPVVSALALIVGGEFGVLFRGIILIFSIPLVFSLIYPLERNLHIQSRRIYLAYIYTLLTLSLTLSWFFVKTVYVHSFWVILFAFASNYVPYQYMAGAENAKGGRVSTLTNAICNYSILSFLVLIISQYVFTLDTLFSYILAMGLFVFMFNSIPIVSDSRPLETKE